MEEKKDGRIVWQSAADEVGKEEEGGGDGMRTGAAWRRRTDQMVTAPAANSRSCLLLLQDIGVTGVTHGCAIGAAEAFAEGGEKGSGGLGGRAGSTDDTALGTGGA